MSTKIGYLDGAKKWHLLRELPKGRAPQDDNRREGQQRSKDRGQEGPDQAASPHQIGIRRDQAREKQVSKKGT